jgi:hypothetical protein
MIQPYTKVATYDYVTKDVNSQYEIPWGGGEEGLPPFQSPFERTPWKG